MNAGRICTETWISSKIDPESFDKGWNFRGAGKNRKRNNRRIEIYFYFQDELLNELIRLQQSKVVDPKVKGILFSGSCCK